MKLRGIVIALAFFAATASDSWGQSQKPLPQTKGVQSDKKSDSAGGGKEKTGEQENKTSQIPVIVPQIPSVELQKEAAPYGHHSGEDASEFWPFLIFGTKLKITDSLLAIFTLLLVVIGAWQGGKLGQTVKSYINGERPHIYPDKHNFARFLPSGAGAVYPSSAGIPFPKISLMFLNVGRTAGIIKEIRGEIALDALPPTPTFTFSPARKQGEIIVRPDTITDPFTFEYNRNLTPQEITEFGVGSRPIFLFGYVKYADAFGFLHTKGFCFRCNLGKPPIELAGGRSYNYTRSEKIPDEYAT